jgi:hypothetical protein
MTTEMNQPAPVEIDMSAVLKVLEESHPDAMRYAMWRVRAEMAEAQLAQLRAAQATD